MKKIVLATANQGKLHELTMLLTDFGLDILLQTELGVVPARETGLTFIENALIKARHAAKMTGFAAIADDSGLSVEALKGVPGVCSARYAGLDASDQENCQQLLTVLQDVPDGQRQAQFHCVLVYLRHWDDPVPRIFHGCWQGVIAREPVGTEGFGYDGIFHLPDLNCSAAQLSVEEKNRLSHRGQAFRQLRAALKNG